ncbi:MAG TPA: hypothetical protein VFU81_03165, partial [Thermomicrobiales bacterium]|nr:hypothetical protein [Thermomicrobiales bacterium]
MSDREAMDDERAAFIDANIDLAFRFLEELFDEPARIEQVPSGSTVYVVPPDAPAVWRGQTARALRAAESGKAAYLWRLGVPAGERAAWRAHVIAPHWPTEGIDPAALYDRASDTLVIDFFRGRRQGVPIPSESYGLLYVDQETDEVVVNVMPQFLAGVVHRDSSLIDLLLHPATQLRGITVDEVREMRNSLLHAEADSLAPLASF